MGGRRMKYVAHIRKADESEQRLESHLFEVGELAARFATKINLPEVGLLLGLLHDFGKYSRAFQNYINSAEGRIDPDQDDFVDASRMKGKIDHSSAGAQHVWRQLKRYGSSGQGELCGQILALCIASHHSGLINCLDEDGNPIFCNRMKKSDEKTHLGECLSNADSNLMQRLDELTAASTVKKMFGAIQQMVEVPKNSEEKVKKLDAFALGMFARFLFSCLVDADRLNSAEFEDLARKIAREKQEKQLNWKAAIDRLENRITQFKQDTLIGKIRAQISNDCLRRALDPQGIYTLTVPTGGGKTLASLRYALRHAKHHKLDRIIYVIPYTSIIEQNAGAVREILENKGDSFPWVLEHHSNLEPGKQTWHSKLVTENWDAPIIFTTMVQFLEILFGGGTTSVRRMHQLANAVLIFDEIQTIPIKCVHMFCNALNFLAQSAGTTAVLCTATQPLLDELRHPENGSLNLAENAELMPDKKSLEEKLRRTDIQNRVRPGGWSEEEIADLSLTNLKDTGSCLVVVNTKNWARSLFLALQNRCQDGTIFHLSTNLYPEHREKILDKIKKRLTADQPVLCISTQLIEAGVDISFASVIRFLAGLDSIVQSAGRCNRHGEFKGRGRVVVINPKSEDENLSGLVDIRAGRNISRRIFGEITLDKILASSTLTEYFKYYFYDRAKEMTYLTKGGDRDDNLVNLLSTNPNNPGKGLSCLNPPNKLPLLKQSFMDAGKWFRVIDAPTQPVIIQHGKGKEIVKQLCSVAKEFDSASYYEALKSAQRFSVNVFPDVWKRLHEQAAIHETQKGEGIFYLMETHYSEEFGLSTEPVAPMSTQIC